MKSLVTIMAHGDHHAQQTFDRHLPFWRAHELPMLVMCPEDSIVRTGLQTICIGKRGHHGSQANARFRTLLGILAKLDYRRHIIFEYDSLCITPEIPAGAKHGVYGISFTDDRPVRSFQLSNTPFEGKLFIHPPIVMTKTTILDVLKAMADIPDDAENGMWDRFLGYACECAEIPVHCFRACGLGYSQNTISSDQLEEACDAAEHGAVLFHGVKSNRVLDGIVNASKLTIA